MSEESYTKANEYFDFDHEAVSKEAERIGRGLPNKTEIAIALYYEVRDGIRYNPYTVQRDTKAFKASHVLEKKVSYCIPKAVLLGAMARYWDIPSKLGLVDVKNHIATPQLLEWLGSNIVRMHGYISLYLDGKWVKATPSFNKELCQKLNVSPLEFNGKEDSLFQEHTKQDQKFMEYINDHGEFESVPFEMIFEYLLKHYPKMETMLIKNRPKDFDV